VKESAAVTQIPHPPSGFAQRSLYTIAPRAKRSFHTVIDAERILGEARGKKSTVSFSADGDEVVLEMQHPVHSAVIKEHLRYQKRADGLVARSFLRELMHSNGDFRKDTFGAPSATYPEVGLPFMLGWFPLDGKRRSVYAWINDRFIAKVYVETDGKATLDLPAGRRDTIAAIMYPDLNDWVHLGSVLTKLAKPLLPKYRMWFEPAAPHRLLRFEGPYGPPGAPEIVLELTEE
jgi:hypothetical protein